MSKIQKKKKKKSIPFTKSYMLKNNHAVLNNKKKRSAYENCLKVWKMPGKFL